MAIAGAAGWANDRRDAVTDIAVRTEPAGPRWECAARGRHGTAGRARWTSISRSDGVVGSRHGCGGDATSGAEHPDAGGYPPSVPLPDASGGPDQWQVAAGRHQRAVRRWRALPDRDAVSMEPAADLFPGIHVRHQPGRIGFGGWAVRARRAGVPVVGGQRSAAWCGDGLAPVRKRGESFGIPLDGRNPVWLGMAGDCLPYESEVASPPTGRCRVPGARGGSRECP